MQLLELDWGRCQTRVKLLTLSSYTTVDRKHQRRKCTMVYLKDSLNASSFLSLFIHNKVLLQRLVAITTDSGDENHLVKKCLLPCSQKESVLVRSEILGLFVNTLAGNYKYSRSNRENLPLLIQMQLSKK